MKTKVIFIILFFFCIQKSIGQDKGTLVYIDPATSFAMGFYAKQMKKGQDKTRKEQSKLKKMQAWATTQLQYANNIQNKVLKGLREVSGTLSNAIQVKQIGENIADCYTYIKEIKNIVEEHPEYSVFGVKATEEFGERLLKVSGDLTYLLKGGEKNLATAGDRYRLLMKVNDEVTMLKIRLINISLVIKRAVRIGFWKSINPFQGYINTDRDLVENIMDKYKYNF